MTFNFTTPFGIAQGFPKCGARVLPLEGARDKQMGRFGVFCLV